MSTKLEQFRDFLAGQADEATRQRIASELEDPTSELNRLLGSVRTVGKDLLKLDLEEGTPAVRPDQPARQPSKETAQLSAAVSEDSDEAAEGTPEDYLNSLGIGDFSGRWKNVTGKGQCVCIVGSGVDGSHPALQGRIRTQVLFDTFGAYKGTCPSGFDFGTFGTRLAGIIAGRSVLRSDLGLSGDGSLRMGLAPECQIVAMTAFGGGGLGGEGGTLAQFLAALDWAIAHKDHPTLGGYEVVLIPVALDPRWQGMVSPVMDDLLDVLRLKGLIPILAAGVAPLGTKATYVGACDRSGHAWGRNGAAANLLAPGVNLYCCQPGIPQTGNAIVGICTGPSLAAAVVAGAIVLLREATGKPARQCLDALVSTAGHGGMISVDRAADHLQVVQDAPLGVAAESASASGQVHDLIRRVHADPRLSAIVLRPSAEH